MATIIMPERPDSADAVALVTELEGHLEPLYPATRIVRPVTSCRKVRRASAAKGHNVGVAPVVRSTADDNLGIAQVHNPQFADAGFRQAGFCPKCKRRIHCTEEEGFPANIGNSFDSGPLAGEDDCGFSAQRGWPARADESYQRLNIRVLHFGAHVLAGVHLHEIHFATDQIQHCLPLAFVQPQIDPRWRSSQSAQTVLDMLQQGRGAHGSIQRVSFGGKRNSESFFAASQTCGFLACHG